MTPAETIAVLESLKEVHGDHLQTCGTQHGPYHVAVCEALADAIAALQAKGADTLAWELLGKLTEAVQVCDSNRGRFSCCDAHDCRCPKSRALSPEHWNGEWVCECGSEELDAAYETAAAALAAQDGGGE